LDKFQLSIDSVEKWLKKIKAKFDRISRENGDPGGAIEATIEIRGVGYSALIVPLSTGVTMLFDTGVAVEGDQMQLGASLTVLVNDRIPFGNFEISNGRLVFKVSTFFEPDEGAPHSALSRCLSSAFVQINNYTPGIKKVFAGEIDAANVVAYAESSMAV
jgi:hypothetical protein